MSLKLQQGGPLNGRVLYQEIDNPGQNDCGFYAFATGLINIIQREIARGNNNPEQLRILNQFTTRPTKYTAREFSNFSYNLRKRSDLGVLTKLKSDLRHILYNQNLRELCQASINIEGCTEKLSASTAYVQFSEIFYSYRSNEPLVDEECNLLYQSEAVREYAQSLAIRLSETKGPKRLAHEIEEAFFSDLFGSNFKEKTLVPWEDELTLSAKQQLIARDRKLLADFKQFLMLSVDFYRSNVSYRLLAKNFPYASTAQVLGKELREDYKKLRHQRVKIVAGGEALQQKDLEAETLYYQIVDEENQQVHVYSPHFKQGYQLKKAKAGNLIRLIRDVDLYGGETLTFNDKDSLKQLLPMANDTIERKIIFRKILLSFIESYARSKFKVALSELSIDQKAHIEQVSELLSLRIAEPLNYETKEDIRAIRGAELQKHVEKNSVIGEALACVKKNREWQATDNDLSYFAELFNVHLSILEDGYETERSQGSNDDKPKITMNNLENFHWTTRLSVAYQTGTDCLKYADWSYKNGPLTKGEVKSILRSYTTGFCATFFPRPHAQKANELIRNCEQGKTTLAEVIADLREYIDTKDYKPGCSFIKRFEYLDSRYRASFEDEILNKRDIERVFAKYVHTGYFRHHLPEAHRILDCCRNPKSDIDAICESIEDYVHGTEFNNNSSFMECVYEVRRLKEFADGKKDENKQALPLASVI